MFGIFYKMQGFVLFTLLIHSPRCSVYVSRRTTECRALIGCSGDLERGIIPDWLTDSCVRNSGNIHAGTPPEPHHNNNRQNHCEIYSSLSGFFQK